MPHGVVPPAQLLRVPSTVVPLGSALVRSRSSPEAGPSRVKAVSMWTRRLWRVFFRLFTRRHEPAREPRRISTTDMPWLAIAMAVTSVSL